MKPPARPRRLSRSLAFTGRVFRVERDQVRLTNGRTVAMDVVRHRGSVVLVARPKPRHVVLIRQFRYAIGRWIWELPAGSLEPGERPDRAARRECAEEIGLAPGRVRRLAALYPTPGFCDERMIFYACDRLAPPRRPAARDEDEQIEPRTFSFAGVTALLRRGDIVDMKTVVGLGLVGHAEGLRILGRLANPRRPDA